MNSIVLHSAEKRAHTKCKHLYARLQKETHSEKGSCERKTKGGESRWNKAIFKKSNNEAGQLRKWEQQPRRTNARALSFMFSSPLPFVAFPPLIFLASLSASHTNTPRFPHVFPVCVQVLWGRYVNLHSDEKEFLIAQKWAMLQTVV